METLADKWAEKVHTDDGFDQDAFFEMCTTSGLVIETIDIPGCYDAYKKLKDGSYIRCEIKEHGGDTTYDNDEEFKKAFTVEKKKE